MDQDVEQMEADDNLPIQQLDDKSEDIVDTTTVGKEASSDIGLTDDCARNKSEESNLTEGTDEVEDRAEGMEIDEPDQVSACPDMVVNEDNNTTDGNASQLMNDVPASNDSENENQMDIEKDAENVNEDAENYEDEKNGAKELNEDDIVKPEETNPEENSETCIIDNLGKTGDEEQELEQPCILDLVNEGSVDSNEKVISEAEGQDTNDRVTEHNDDESVGDEPQVDNNSKENLGIEDIEETDDPVSMNQVNDQTNEPDINKIAASPIDAVNMTETDADGATDDEEKCEANKEQVLKPNVDILDDDSVGINTEDDGIKQQSFFQDTERTESEKEQQVDTENSVNVLSNEDRSTSDAMEVSDEILLEDKQELEEDSCDKHVDSDKVIDNDTSVHKTDSEENQREECEDIVIGDEGCVELANSKVELSEGKVELSDDKVELSDENVELPDDKVELIDDKVELSDEKVELSEGKVELSDDKVELSDDKVELIDDKVELSDDKVELSKNKAEHIDDSDMNITENIESDENNEGDEVVKIAQEVKQDADETDVIDSTVEENTVSDKPLEQNDEESNGSGKTESVDKSDEGKKASIYQETDSNEMETDDVSVSQVVKSEAPGVSDDLKSGAAVVEDSNTEVAMETTDLENYPNQSKEKPKDQSEESEGRNSQSPSGDMAGVEIKQERTSSVDEEKVGETESSNSSNLKIVNVTSAVGVTSDVGVDVEDNKVKSEAETTGEAKAEKKAKENKPDTKDVNEFVRTVSGIGQDENFDILDDDVDITDEELIHSSTDCNQTCQASTLVDPDTQQTKKRFKTVSESEINKLKCQITESTTDRSTKWAVGLIKAWMSENEYPDEDFENLDLSALDSLLQKFYASLQSKKSVSYSRSALVAIRAGINRYLTSPPYSRLLNLMKDREFMPSNQVLRGIIKSLKMEGKDVTKSKELITEEDHMMLYECGVFSVDDPETLQNKVIYEIIAHFGRICRETLKSLIKSSITIKEDIDGRHYVIMTDNDTHRTDGREKSEEARMYETKDEFCPVRSFEKYMSKLHPDCDRLFQRPVRAIIDPVSEVWYENSSLGINKELAADLSQRYTNNCIHTFTSTDLHRQRSSNGAVMSGPVYRSTTSLTSHIQPNIDGDFDPGNNIIFGTSSDPPESSEGLSDEVTTVEDKKTDKQELEDLYASNDIDNQAASSSSTIELSSDLFEAKLDKFPGSDNMKFVEKGEDDDVIAVKEEKKPTPKTKSSKIQTCIVCKKVVKCKYNIVRNGDVKHLCDDNCFKRFRSNPTTYLKQAEAKNDKSKTYPEIQPKETASPGSNATPVSSSKSDSNQPTPVAQSQVYKTCTVCQLMNVRTSKPFLNWQGLDFCGEECLGKFQFGLDSNCSYCSGPIFPNNKAKFCCRAGNEVKHFCSSVCNNDFVKRMKLCAYCSKDLSHIKDSFMAPVGNQGTFKDFCSQTCLQKFEDKNNKDLEIVGVQTGQKTSKAPKGDFTCAVCSKFGPVKHEFKLDSKMNRLCSDPCFSAFQYANKLTLNACDNCSTNLNAENQAPQYVQFEGQQKRFCSFMCVNIFMSSNKKTVPCAWCGSKKSNFDMIERVDANNKYQLFCSLNCLSLYRVNLQASSNQSVVCDQCRKFVPAQYHLTMSDASVRNFCSYGCVMQFQQQFQMPAKQPHQNTAGKTVAQALQKQLTTTTRSGRVVANKGNKLASVLETQKQPKAGKKDSNSFPVISNVMSLAPQGSQQQNNIKSTQPVQPMNVKASASSGSQTVQQKVIIQPPPPKVMKNKSMLCKPITQTKATSCRPHTQTKEVQTEGKPEPDKLPVPVPVPIYCPTPLAMYSVPTPVFVAIPVPVPVPIFIPTTKKSAGSILKQIKEIREKIPADPLEAELLMMAEAVAGKGEDSSSSSEEEETPVPVVKEAPPVPAPSSGAELGEDMLQMALRMASEMSDEPVMDLETSLEPVAVNTEPPPQPKPEIPPEPEEEDENIPSTRARRARGGSKRQARSSTRRNPKRQKVEIQQVYREPTPSPPAPAVPPPDANFHLKYTYGVNAFKHWVIQKNSQMEQSSGPGPGKAVKTFKTDILQSTADELNYALCLFVKEVRKPNGEEYAVDSIYYLCLGIQQYLFENGRIDNIFTDFYYERFTEGLNEILTRYEPKLNHTGQLVCRIEEEHLWESKQLGAHSPHVLLNSLVYFNTKYFMLKTSDDHLKLSFTHIMKHWKKTASGRGSGTGPNAGRSVYLRYYCPTPQGKVDNQKKKKEEMPVFEQTENLENPLRCPVKLYEFYLSKCPESIKSRNDTFYLQAERSSVPDSPVWYSNISVDGDRLAKLLNRIRLVREIQEAHLHTQPIYI